jgi:hypothetical protein
MTDNNDALWVCLNGHVVNDGFKECNICNAKTICSCKQEHCQFKLEDKSFYKTGDLYYKDKCPSCWNLYPWRDQKVLDLLEEMESLGANKADLKYNINDIVNETQYTERAARKVKNILKGANPDDRNKFYDFVQDQKETMPEQAYKIIMGL